MTNKEQIELEIKIKNEEYGQPDFLDIFSWKWLLFLLGFAALAALVWLVIL